jgi:predicted metalloprotease with PDZ domain
MKLKNRNNLKKISKIFLAFCLINIFGSFAANAQDIEAKIKIVSAASPLVRIEGKVLNSGGNFLNRNWSFPQNYADASELGKRIENLSLFDEAGKKIEIKKLADGEFQAEKPAFSFAYEVKTKVPDRLTSAAHVSWLSADLGLLMLNDLLPLRQTKQPVSAKIILEIPAGWKSASSEKQNPENIFDVKNIENAVFLIGKNWRGQTVRIDKTELNLAVAGEWQFSDEEALQMAGSILEENRKIFGEIPVDKSQIFLLPFPQKTNQPDRWQAETRGATVTILSGALPFKNQALQRLHEQLRHEIFHLWMPNALALSGNYDWFYEGFTVYAALRMGVEVNQIRFDDYLNTLARAYDLAQNQSDSLIEISNKRWAGGNNSVYAKGMIAAFLSDAALLRESRSRRSLSDVFRQIYKKHRAPNAVQDGNAAILDILKSYPELRPVIQKYIEGNSKVEWTDELKNLGIEIGKNGQGTALKVSAKLDNRQKDLLDKLGYNQWRKLLQKRK